MKTFLTTHNANKDGKTFPDFGATIVPEQGTENGGAENASMRCGVERT